MDKEMQEKIYEMHGTVNRLEQKTDNLIEKQGNLDAEISKLDEDLEEVSNQADSNQKKVYGLFLVGGVTSTVLVIVATFVSSPIP